MNYTEWCSQLRNCRQCKLCETRTQVVISDGNISANIFCVGEAPGFYEDKEGKPFVGRSGKLLREVLSNIGLTNEDYYITNIVKCRPPDNRDPLPEELKTCGKYLIEQIEKFATPKIIVGVGRISSGIIWKDYLHSRDHGEIFHRINYDFMGTYHPSAALRNPDWKREMILDLKQLGKYK